VQVPRELYWAIALNADREDKSMGEIVLECGWRRLRRVKPPKGTSKAPTSAADS
jgi:hypothetical protein